MDMKTEYLKRNLLVAKAYGVRSGVENAMARMQERKDCPKWLLDELHDCLDRIEPLIPALIAHRQEVRRGEGIMPPNA